MLQERTSALGESDQRGKAGGFNGCHAANAAGAAQPL
jgi:hypothetical protein